MTLLLGAMGVLSCTQDRKALEGSLLHDRPFRLKESNCAPAYVGVNPQANVVPCQRHLSCLGSSVTNDNFSVINMNKANQVWRAVYVGNQYQPTLDIPFEIGNGFTYAGRFEVESNSLIQWQLATQSGTVSCLAPNGACDMALSGYEVQGGQNDTKLILSWSGQNCRETYVLWTEMCGAFDVCETP